MKKQIGRYDIQRQLGEGASAQVYLAQDRVLDRPVVLKILKSTLVADSMIFQRFQQEARAVARLMHPHIVTVYDMAETEGLFYIVMHYVDGGSLDALLKAAPLPGGEVQRMLSQVGAALEYAHAQGFLHRDVKPANILRDGKGDYWLTDFGLAKVLQDSIIQSVSGGILGTPAYIPPEIWLEQPATPQTDQYALACVVYEALTGEVLFTGSTPPAVMTKHVTGTMDLMHPNLDDHLRQVLAQALAKDLQARYESIGAFVAQVQNKGDVTPEPVQHPQVQPVTAAKQAPSQVRREPQIGEEYQLELPGGVMMNFVYVPAGEFLMGAAEDDNEAFDDEKPQHVVYLDAYWIGKTPVTNRQYAICVQHCAANSPRKIEPFIDNEKQNHPVIDVSFKDANAYCLWLSQEFGNRASLPTEAQWEKAARGTDGRLYPWGNQPPNSHLANFGRNIWDTTDVDRYLAGSSPYGALDKAGNVWEYVIDYYRNYDNVYQKNPIGINESVFRVHRGGSCWDSSRLIRSSLRGMFDLRTSKDVIGFRCVLIPR